MPIGNQPSANDVSREAGDIAVMTTALFLRVKRFNRWAKGYTAAELGTLGLTAADATLILAFAADMDNLADVADGTLPQVLAKDFLANARKLAGFGYREIR